MTDSVQQLGDGLVLRNVRGARDIAQYVALHAACVSKVEARTCDHLMRHHPVTTLDDYLVVEDERTRHIVATICLLPWRLRLEGSALRAAMLEMVVTHPEYRRRGLVRALIERFHRRVVEQGYDLSIIEGIPYYYRQFGYTHVIDHRSYDALPVAAIPPEALSLRAHYTFRPAGPADAEILTRLYRDATSSLGIHVERDATYWRFLLGWERFPVHVVQERDSGAAVGYLAATPPTRAGAVSLLEGAVQSHDASLAVLGWLGVEASSEVQLAWPQTGALLQLARSLGSVAHPTYQWLARITDIAAFLRKIGPVLEQRVAASDCAGLTTELSVNLFREAFLLRFIAGRLRDVQSIGFVDSSMGADGGDLCIPPDAFVRLVLGYRDLDILRDAWPDIVIRPGRRRLLDVLFPAMSSYLCLPYMYFGPV